MPRPAKGARLYLRAARPGRERLWVILDGPSECGTGCREGEREQAEKALAAYIAEKHAPPTPAKAPSDLASVLIATVVRVYLDERAPLTRSAEWIGFMVDPILDRLGTKPLSAVNSSLCAEYVASREGEVSISTARHELKNLRAAIRYFHGSRFGPLPSVPVVTLPPKRRPRVNYFLTRDQLAQRIRAARRLPQMKHMPRLLLIGWYSASRPGTILSLRWVPSTSGGWFDLDGKVLHRLAEDEQESNKRKTPARIHERLLSHLRRWRDADMAKGITHCVHYFGKPVGDVRKAWDATAIEAGHAKQTGVDANGQPIWKVADGPHILRHSAVTWLLQDGVPAFEVAGFAAMDIETLQSVYGHHSPDYQQRVATAHGKRTFAQDTPKKPVSNSVIDRHVAAPKPYKA